MGAGKTTIGKQLSNKLRYNFIDLDQFIEESNQISISSIFSNKGESYFRDIESLHLKKVLELDNTVISLGGGTPCFNNNMRLIKNHSKSIFIDLPTKMLVSRLKNGRLKRPLIQDKSDDELFDFINTLRSKRLSYYNQANLIINKREDIISHILDFINTNKH